MDLFINLKVNFRGNSKNFLLSGSETRNWEAMEAMVKRSFGLCNLQLTYSDEENEEVSINSQAEYEEALKSAVRQGNRLYMTVHEIRAQTAQTTRPAAAKPSATEPKRGFRPPQLCPALTQVVSRKVQAAVPEQGAMVLKEGRGSKEEDKTPPAWFTSYMEKFKDQVVREAVEKICREFSGQCCIHKPLGGGGRGGGSLGEAAGGGARGETVGGRAETQQVPQVSSSTLPGGLSSSTPPCSSCRGQTTGGGYQCSVCMSCTLCEPCSLSHDPSHNLVRARTPLSIPEHGSPAPDHSRFYRRGDRSFRKAEKQRLKAEKRLLKAEVKEIRKQLRMERRGIQWSCTLLDGSASPVLLQPRASQHSSPDRPKRPCPLVVPTMTAVFLDENLPDGTRLRPGTKFMKYWKMRNTGSVGWSSDTKLKFMWGNLAVGSGERWREVPVPFLHPGQVGIVSVALCAPSLDGSYTSHWRLAHAGEQFGPRVWCSIVVDPQAPAPVMADGILVSPCVTPQGKNPIGKDGKSLMACRGQSLLSGGQEDECFIPSVDLLTAQDLLSFELLDINIVQELDSVPTSTPSDSAPSVSPPTPHRAPQDKASPSLGLIQEETEMANSILEGGVVPAQEEGDEDVSGSQFVIGSMTRREGLGLAPLRVGRLAAGRGCPASAGGSAPSCVRAEGCAETSLKAALPDPLSMVHMPTPGPSPCCSPALGPSSALAPLPVPVYGPTGGLLLGGPDREEEPQAVYEARPKGRSRSSSTSSEDYIIILPDCFDTSRPLGESMYSSVLSQPGDGLTKTPNELEAPPTGQGEAGTEGAGQEVEQEARQEAAVTGASNTANDMLCTSQTLNDKPLSPELVAPPTASTDSGGQKDAEPEGETEHGEDQAEDDSDAETSNTEAEDAEEPSALVKGALSVAASAYKALLTGHGPTQPPLDASTRDTMMAVLVEMGFVDRPLNQHLLRKHNFNLLDVVSELVQLTDSDWYSTPH